MDKGNAIAYYQLAGCYDQGCYDQGTMCMP